MKAQREFIPSDHSGALQMSGKVLQIERPGAFMDLHCIAAAKADWRSAVALQIWKIAFATGRALRIAIGDSGLPNWPVPQVRGEDHGPADFSGQNLQRLH